MTSGVYRRTEEMKKKRSNFRKGLKISEETKRKIGLGNEGKIRSEETKKKLSLINKGKKLSEEHKRNISLAQLGKKRQPFSKEHKDKISLANKGKHQSEEHKKRMVETRMKNGSYVVSEETKRKIGLNGFHYGMLGKHHSEETIKKIKITDSRLEYKKLARERRAKQILPVKDTSIEIKIQNYLKILGIDFFTHRYIKEIEHAYQCDILIPSKNLVIECDGNYWHNYPIGNETDIMRNIELRKAGYSVLRFWENDIRVMEIEDLKNKLIQMGVKK